jgi:Spy/CpxP family protein refolding chaperone
MRLIHSLTLMLVALPIGLAAQPHRQGPMPLERITDRLLEDPEIVEAADLEEEQIEAIRDLVHDFHAFQIENRAARDLARLELDRLWQSDEPDADAIHEAVEEQSQLQAAMQHRMADLRLGVREVLTPEQRDAIEETVRQRFQERRANVRNDRGARGERAGAGFGLPAIRPPMAPRPAMAPQALGEGPDGDAESPLIPPAPPLPRV